RARRHAPADPADVRDEGPRAAAAHAGRHAALLRGRRRAAPDHPAAHVRARPQPRRRRARAAARGGAPQGARAGGARAAAVAPRGAERAQAVPPRPRARARRAAPREESNPMTAERAALKLRSTLEGLTFAELHVYNPLDYAWAVHRDYLRRYASRRKLVLFVGMNPGPFGTVQTGVPFGEVAAVQGWLGLVGPVCAPVDVHPKRPVLGFGCTRSEVSGRRLWGLFRARYGTAERFFAEHTVMNYCPLAFVEGTGRNRTPEKLPLQ